MDSFQDLVGLVEMVKYGKDPAYTPLDLHYITYIDKTDALALVLTGIVSLKLSC